MKKINLTLTGTQKYWYHSGLIDVIKKQSGWDESKIKNFLSTNQVINFNQMDKTQAAAILEDVERAGFEIELLETKTGLNVALKFPDWSVLGEIKSQIQEIRAEPLYAVQNQLREILEKLNQLETHQAATELKKSIKDDPIYQNLIAAPPVIVEPEVEEKPQAAVYTPKAAPKPFVTEEKKSSAEANIGKYWLSRIGIVTLLLGVVFLITYTSQFLGAWGKLGIGALSGAVLAITGNFLAQKEKYHRWAMSAIGGGWAIIYFTVFAAYHVPMVKVIQDPISGFLLLLIAGIGSISQSLKYRSQALIFMSYFLAYFATVSTTITPFSLIASLLLAISLMILTRKLGWNWLAIFGMTAVYLIHWLWVQPFLYGINQSNAGSEAVWEMLILPWTGNTWRIYPMPDMAKSLIHLSFLLIYWVLFSFMSIMRPKEQKSPRALIGMTVANNLIFIFSVMHHLHVYFPAFKWVFSLVTAAVLFSFSMIESKRKEALLADIYLAFSVSLFCLTIPLCLRGTSITYGWAAAAVCLMWLSFKHHRFILRTIGWIMALFVLARIFIFDYQEREALFTMILPVYPFLLTAIVAAAAFLMIHIIYCKHEEQISSPEARFFQTASLITASLLAGWAFLMGGFRDISSFTTMAIGCGLLTWGAVKKNIHYRMAAMFFLVCAVVRILTVDCGYALSLIFSQPPVLLRHVSVAAAIIGLLVQAEYLRRRQSQTEQDFWNFPALAIGAPILFMTLVSDSSLNFMRSMIWGAAAFGFIVMGFAWKEKLYRWIGLAMFGCIVIRLFVFDFAQMDMIYRIISFIALGIVFIVASFIYNYYSKTLLSDPKD